MNILFVIDQLNCGGSEQQLITLCQGLRRRGHDATVVTIYGRTELRDELAAIQVPVIVAGKYGRLDLTVVWRLRRLINRIKPDLVHTFLSGASFLTPMTKWLTVTTPIVQSERSVNGWRTGVRLRVENILRRRVAGITCNAGAIKRHLVENERVQSDKIAVIYNGLGSHRRSRPSDEDIEAASRRIGAPAGAVIVVCVANFSALKQHRTLVAAFATAKARADELFLLLIGQGELESAIRADLAWMGLTRSSCVITDCTNPLAFLCASHIAILTSMVEGCSNALLEAMAMGLPIVASDAGGNGELVAQGHGGYLCPIGNSDSFAAAMVALTRDPECRSRMGRYNAARIQDQFTDDVMVDRSLAFYTKIIGRSSCTPWGSQVVDPVGDFLHSA